MWTRIKRFAGNLLVVVVSVVVTYLVLQLVFFRLVLTNVPLPVRPWLPETAGVLMQSTKAAPVPRDYVAIMGDSYAEGLGDWLLRAGDDDSRGFNAAHVIHQMTGWDVVSFGKAGAGSAEALVLLPSRALKGSQCLSFPSIGDPERILAYFFEGNDIEDNLRFLDKVRGRYGRADAADIDALLTSDYTAYPWWRCHGHLGDVVSRIVKFDYLYFTGQMNVLPQPAHRPNAYMVAGGVLDAPVTEGPALEVDSGQVTAAVGVFARALAWLRTRFPHARISVVYIPSPLALYRAAGAELEAEFLASIGYTSRRVPAGEVARRSEQICNLVREAAGREQVGFINPGPRLRQEAARRAIHGPVDWHHFNEIGYRVFGEELVRGLRGAAADTCPAAAVAIGGAP